MRSAGPLAFPWCRCLCQPYFLLDLVSLLLLFGVPLHFSLARKASAVLQVESKAAACEWSTQFPQGPASSCLVLPFLGLCFPLHKTLTGPLECLNPQLPAVLPGVSSVSAGAQWTLRFQNLSSSCFSLLQDSELKNIGPCGSTCHSSELQVTAAVVLCQQVVLLLSSRSFPQPFSAFVVSAGCLPQASAATLLLRVHVQLL